MSFGDQAAASVAANRASRPLAGGCPPAGVPELEHRQRPTPAEHRRFHAHEERHPGTGVAEQRAQRRRAPARRFPPRHPAGPALPPALIALAAWWVVRAGLEPLNRFRRVAAQVSPQDLSYRIPEQNLPRELDSLARSFNHARPPRRGWRTPALAVFDDLAHELRAPICNLLVRNQVLLSQHRDSAAYREALESMPRNWSGCRGSSPTCCSWCRWTTRRSRPSSAASPCTSRRPRSSTCTRWSPRTRASNCACPAAASPTATT